MLQLLFSICWWCCGSTVISLTEDSHDQPKQTYDANRRTNVGSILAAHSLRMPHGKCLTEDFYHHPTLDMVVGRANVGNSSLPNQHAPWKRSPVFSDGSGKDWCGDLVFLLFGFNILTTSKVLSWWVSTCDSAHQKLIVQPHWETKPSALSHNFLRSYIILI